MTKKQLFQFISFFQKKEWQVFGPQKIGKEIIIDKIEEPKSFYLGPELPLHSFKSFFIPQREILFELKDGREKTSKADYSQIVIFGASVLDLRAIRLYDLVFKEDPYYQERRKKIFIIGFQPGEKINRPNYKTELIEETLPYLKFDIFLYPEKDNFQIFFGSPAGKKILEDFNYLKAFLIEFRGFFNKKDKELCFKFSSVLKKGPNLEVWRKLGEICIECGKCSVVCPTCFCFRIADGFGLLNKETFMERCQDSCFFSEFSEVASGHKFLDTAQKKIHFWYYHKFARIPDEYKIRGCVGCHRCARVCPVGIDIKKVLKQLENVEKSLSN